MKRNAGFAPLVAKAGILGVGILGLTASHAAAQSPTLDVTLGFIRDAVAQQGKLNFASTTRDPADGQSWDNQFTVEASNVTSDESQCTIGWHWVSTVDGKSAQDLDAEVDFKIVTSATITSLDDDIARLNASDGHAAWVSQMRPPIAVLLVRKSNGHANTVDFSDRDLAERVAKAVRHAADLCGGTKSEPF